MRNFFFGGGCKDVGKKYGMEIINYDIVNIIKLMLSSQSRKIYQFFWAISCCRYKIYGFRGIFFLRNSL